MREATVEHERRERSEHLALGPSLATVKVDTVRAERVTVLPGDVRGYNQITLFPKISGYAKELRFERGDRVAKDQILAIIESPELDEQVAQALSDLSAKRANAARAKSVASRGALSLFDRDNLEAAARVAEAELGRTSALRAYTVIRAPFSGIVTTRYVDPGAFLPAATGSTQSAVPIADVADLDTVRVLIYPGQDIALFAHAGDPAAVWERERPDRRIEASVTRCGQGLDRSTRTMTCEVVIDNRTADLRPGSFVEVELHQRVAPFPAVPNEAILIRGGNSFVAIVDQGHVHLQPITLGDTDGRTARVENGLRGGETIGINVPVGIDEGAMVRPMAEPPAPAIGGGPSSRDGGSPP